MREWMAAQSGPFTAMQVCEGLGLTPGEERDRLRNAIPDFLLRGEVVKCADRVLNVRGGRHIFVDHSDERNRRQNSYWYNPAWRRAQKGSDKKKILKAAWVSYVEFTVSDLERLSGAGKSHVDKTVRELREGGHIRAVGRRACAHGNGAEILYQVANRDRYRKEVME